MNKKPTTVSSRGFLLKLLLSATRPGGIVVYYYDDYPGYYELRGKIHDLDNKAWENEGQAWIPGRKTGLHFCKDRAQKEFKALSAKIRIASPRENSQLSARNE